MTRTEQLLSCQHISDITSDILLIIMFASRIPRDAYITVNHKKMAVHL